MNNTGTFKAMGELPDDVIDDFKNERYDVCVKKCNNILTTNPNNGFAFIYLGKIAESEKDHEAAIKYFKKVTEIEPRFPYTWGYIGENYTSLEKYKEAYEAYTEGIALLPHKAAPWCMASLSAQKMGDNEFAKGILKLAQKQVEKEGQSIIAFALGTLEEVSGNKEEALMNYMQGQITAENEEDKLSSSERIYKMLKKE
jgi:tetratricopeptide (TPR) repeat protein